MADSAISDQLPCFKFAKVQDMKGGQKQKQNNVSAFMESTILNPDFNHFLLKQMKKQNQANKKAQGGSEIR